MKSCEKIIARPTLYKTFEKELFSKKILFLSAQSGWGKTTTVLDWLKNSKKPYSYLSKRQENFSTRLKQETAKRIVIDDFQMIITDPEEKEILDALTTKPNSSFIFISRARLPYYLKPYQLTSQITYFDHKILFFGREMITELLKYYQIKSPALAIQIETATRGYTMAICFLVKRLANGEEMNEITIQRVAKDMFDCYDALIFPYWDVEVQKLLLHMACFMRFSEKMARMVTGNKNVASVIQKAVKSGSFLTHEPPDTYVMHDVMHKYMIAKQKQIYSREYILSIYHNAALYYELEEDIANALHYYQLSDNHEKVAELLVTNSEKHPGNGHYYETEHYYRALPVETIFNSIELMCGMSMLCSLCCQPQESEYWYQKLEETKKKYDKSDKHYRQIEGKLAYLKIALPHRGSKHIASILLDVAKAYSAGTFRLQEFSVTSNLPSVLNGGKDFCSWVKHDRKYYHFMKAPLELLFGKYGIGLADIALADSLFEKSSSDNLTEIILLLESGQNAASFRGTMEMEFVAVAIMCRILLLKNNLSAAYLKLDHMKIRAKRKKMRGIEDNLEALRTFFLLEEGKVDEVLIWLNDKAPDETKKFQILERFRYITKIKCYLALGRYTQALSLLGKMLDYAKQYNRTLIQLEAELLLSITQYHMNEEVWETTLKEALRKCEGYGFIRFIAEQGAALLPLFGKISGATKTEYFEKLGKEIKQMALLYPHYLKRKENLLEPLTDTEKTVLRLLCKGLSNDEIANLMGITLRTVKFHTGNLYAKMNVKGRLEATKNAALILQEE